MGHHQIEAVQQAERDEVPAGAVPDTGDEHGEYGGVGDQCEEGTGRHLAAPWLWLAGRHARAGHAQHDGVVDVGGEEARQRHVPARPVVDDVARLERAVEVRRQADAEQQRQADGHVAVAGEVEVDLQRVGQRAGPGIVERRDAAVGSQAEDRRGFQREGVGDHHLLEQPEQKHRGAQRQVVDARAEAVAVVELREHFPVVGDRPGDQLRKEADEQAVVGEVVFFHHAVMGIDQVGDLLEGEEGDRQRQDDVFHPPTEIQRRIQRTEQEAGVFVVDQQQHVGRDRQPEHQT